MLTDLSFEELPEIPPIWLDFVRCRLSLLPAMRATPALLANAEALRDRAIYKDELHQLLAGASDLCSDRTLESLLRLQQTGSVVVLTNFYPGLFGGPAFQILKCLTAIKICEELARQKLTAVPVCWIHSSLPPDSSKCSIQLLDSESEIHCLQLQQPQTHSFSSGDLLPSGQIAALISQIEALGRDTYDPEILGILSDSFSPETTFAQASARLVAALLKNWGMIILNPHARDFQSYICEVAAPFRAQAEKMGVLRQSRTAESDEAGKVGQWLDEALYTQLAQSAILPALVCVIDPYEVHSCIKAQSVFDVFQMIQPMAWPQVSATVLDARSRRTLERYEIHPAQIYSGEKILASRIMGTMPQKASEKLYSLRQEAEDRISRLRALPSAGKEFRKATGSAREKIVFQLDKLRENHDAASKTNQETVSRRIHRVCNSLAPNGRIQERELAGIQLPLRYSRAVLRSLYEKLDILRLDHQLISLD